MTYANITYVCKRCSALSDRAPTVAEVRAPLAQGAFTAPLVFCAACLADLESQAEEDEKVRPEAVLMDLATVETVETPQVKPALIFPPGGKSN